jgi:hypothetical protein
LSPVLETVARERKSFYQSVRRGIRFLDIFRVLNINDMIRWMGW